MDVKNLLCEGWIEKQVVFSNQSTSVQGKRWKTRYAVLILHSKRNVIEVRFYQKKPRVHTDITDDSITLLPWRYIVDMTSESKDRSHIVRIQVYDNGYVTPASMLIKMSMQYNGEALAWTRCIQKITKLTSGIQGHAFVVVPGSSQSIGVFDHHCILHVAAEAVILALKNDHSVVAVWPLSSIRNYSTSDPSHFTITAGRRSPLGEGGYVFQTMQGDGDELFSLLDHYTGVTSATMLSSPKNSETLNIRPSATVRQQCRSSQPTSQSVLASSTCRLSSVPPSKPPRKPPLPKGMSFSMPKSAIHPDPAVCSSQTSKPIVKNQVEDERTQKSTALTRGLYDLDKLLYTLEGNLKPEDPDNEKENILGVCREVLADVLEAVAKNNEDVFVHSDTKRYENKVNVTAIAANENTKTGNVSHLSKVHCKVQKPETHYASVDLRKKSFKKK